MSRIFGRKELIEYLYRIDTYYDYEPEEIAHYIFSKLSEEFIALGEDCFDRGLIEEGEHWYQAAGYLAAELF